MESRHDQHEITLTRRKKDLPGGDILFLISCSEIVKAADRRAYSACLVLHASDLPHGRGWSPHIWAIVGGAQELTLSLLTAEDKVDSGSIWHKIIFPVPKDALWDEINERLFNAEIELIDYAVEEFESFHPCQQDPEVEPTYYSRRTPEHSRIDPNLSIANQFDLIRVCDPVRFPAYFELHGCCYRLTIEKVNG
jgi:methionyl-tRNA formyltransferase